MRKIISDAIQFARVMRPAPLTRADKISVPPTRWVWEGMIAEGHFVMVIGEPGIGKSQAVMDIAARTTTGRPWPDGTVNKHPGGVAFFETEDPIAETLARAEAAGADRSRLFMSTMERDLSTQTGVAALERDLDQIENPRMVVLSPIRMFFGEKESARQVDTRKRLNLLLAMADRRRIAIIGIGHKSSGKGGRSAEDAAGPQAYAQRARSVLTAMADPLDPLFKKNPKLARRLLVSAKANNTKDSFELAYKIVGARTAAGEPTSRIEWLERRETLALPAPKQGAVLWLRERLSNEDRGFAYAADVEHDASAAGFSRSALYRAHKEIGVISSRDGFQGQVTWALP
jgi:hypothetical protein